MTTADILRLRLEQQFITKPFTGKAPELIWHLCAIQAQDYAAAKWAIGLRMPGFTDEMADAAFTNKSLVRAYSIRGTIHVMHPEDARWLISFARNRYIITSASLHRKLELDEKTFSKSNSIIRKGLADGQELTRDELKSLLEKKKIDCESQRLNHMLYRAGMDEVLCFGKRRGKEFTYALLDDYVPAGKSVPVKDALYQLALRFVTGHGPATAQDLSWWTGYPITACKTAFLSLKGELQNETIDKQEYWMLPGAQTGKPATGLKLLSGFDEYYMGFKDKSLLLDKTFSKSMSPPNGLLPYIILLNGKIAGTWRRNIKKNCVGMEYQPFKPLTAAQQKSLKDAEKKFCKFLGLPPEQAG
ncbi:winged helix DNA-binding domain-containing protein [Chitinophaga sp. GCM10012297]|uniref:AlkZ family DNA glycosylase n=1 Tax=Chitinophaga chungangae TaxID=2821488 RepID=A0ABS3YDW9_9BACT|nr:winged helix DNA-binding domain-containing protein [Chitinophaga chungangae]MBO9152870.1 AlkZ family DNA glycosylase [Chitinophaga chungangae]